ncbi:hypothetical protein FOMPIDRAFT_1024170 [Fomitopsis schrenkii]|uniref:Uncharacterized protein n=1 Tax=Fomitopsis schrenkii TaxID=2126942 RepID=S8E826_FOMSC|nr:hypothetical protein FOMPIDRAFT_1024170 [Fomitopsis schrenkii]
MDASLYSVPAPGPVSGIAASGKLCRRPADPRRARTLTAAPIAPRGLANLPVPF